MNESLRLLGSPTDFGEGLKHVVCAKLTITIATSRMFPIWLCVVNESVKAPVLQHFPRQKLWQVVPGLGTGEDPLRQPCTF